MNPTRAYKLVETVRQECRLALLALTRLRTAVNESDQEWLFLNAHAVLLHAREVALFLVPSRPGSVARGEFLRRELGVEAGSALLLPALRELHERSDETYEDWVDGLESPRYLEMTVMPQGALAGSSPDAFQRRLDPDSLRFGFRNWTIDLHQLGSALRRLDSACQQWLRARSLLSGQAST